LIVGLGIDLVELSRVESSLRKWGERLVQKLMGADESSRLVALASTRAEAVAISIALKEAASKAIGTGWSQGVRWRDIVVFPGPPITVELRLRAAEFARRLDSDGGTSALVERRGDLILAEVQLRGRATGRDGQAMTGRRN
jgi:holo-[acyl-carrier protein] synthase